MVRTKACRNIRGGGLWAHGKTLYSNLPVLWACTEFWWLWSPTSKFARRPLDPKTSREHSAPAEPMISRRQRISDNEGRGNQHPQDCRATDFDKLLTWSCLHCGCVWVLVYGGSSLVPTSPVPAEGQRPLFSRPPAAASEFHPARRSLLLTNWKRRHTERAYSLRYLVKGTLKFKSSSYVFF